MAAAPEALSYANHRRYDLAYHGFVFGVLIVSLLLAVWNVIRWKQAMSVWWVILTIAMIVLALKTRLYALKVQDRVIRIEERMRLSSLLPEPYRARISELSIRQLVALRFVPDAELPALAAKALDEKLTEDQIKRAIVSWRSDDDRI